MALSDLHPGDVVYAATALYNDGGLPGMENEAMLAVAGTRGVLVNVGHAEEDPRRIVYLVRFEDAHQRLGIPVGCLPEELTDNPDGIAP